jgi:hypothetical protein
VSLWRASLSQYATTCGGGSVGVAYSSGISDNNYLLYHCSWGGALTPSEPAEAKVFIGWKCSALIEKMSDPSLCAHKQGQRDYYDPTRLWAQTSTNTGLVPNTTISAGAVPMALEGKVLGSRLGRARVVGCGKIQHNQRVSGCVRPCMRA